MKFIVPALAVACLLAAGCASAPKVQPGLVTTTPVTQNHDDANYDAWQKRHAEILAYNGTHQPQIVVIGDGLVQSWGGEPPAPPVWNPSAWNNAFAGFTAENLGFSYDRTEHVLWRIEHGELDGIAPKLIIIQIGNQNIGRKVGKDADQKIAAGIEAVCAVAHAKQPAAKILLLGILPHHYGKSTSRVIPDRINQRLQARLGNVSWLKFCDISDSFRNADGSINAALFRDGTHLNAAGYEVLAAKVHEQIAVLIKRVR